MSNYRAALDIGSTTVKLVIIGEQDNILFSKYKRHFSDIKLAIKKMFEDAIIEFGDVDFKINVTGSGGLNVSEWLDIPFVQEVVAVAKAIERNVQKCNVAIEIGGEDAKIIYFNNTIEQRMNGICAGGTGAFIDQMSALLQTDATGLNEYAKSFDTIYPIAARCGVFAKSDIQPLINEGASKPNLAASIFQAVVTQTISGLACGMPIRGNVVFLGGPLHFLSELRNRFIDVLELTDEQAIVPENSHLFAALGSAYKIACEQEIRNFSYYINKLNNNVNSNTEIARLEPLFRTENDLQNFIKRHESATVNKIDLENYKGNAFLGIDAGSTTTKLALISENGDLLRSYYTNNSGNPIDETRKILLDIYNHLHRDIKIVNSCVTGYGEVLLKEAFKIDFGEIETVAHYKAAAYFDPDVDFILDIGGQDMKCIRIKDKVIDNILLNEACSAGCGSFIETFANAIGLSAKEFSILALDSKKPIDLGSRCTVFMNSRVKQAQKEGAEVSDISAGLAYSVIKNALQKVIKITDPKQMGKKIIVQGGTFYNNAVLRCFEIISEREAIRPDIAGIMGAFGAAILAKENYQEGYVSTLATPEEIKNFKMTTKTTRCKKCENNCVLTINSFDNKRNLVSGNRCEKGAPTTNKSSNNIPNLYAYKYERLFAYTPKSPEKATRGAIGIPRVLNMYEEYPFWFTIFNELDFSVKLSAQSSRTIYEKGIESMPSESVCYPAKLTHGHIVDLIQDGVKTIFYPSVVYEKQRIEGTDENYNCPIVISYPENIKNNVEELNNDDIKFINPFFNLNDQKSVTKNLIDQFPYISKDEISKAVEKAYSELDNFYLDINKKGEEILKYINENNLKAIVLAGRPYHIDPEINHGIDKMLTDYNFAVLTEDSVAHIGLDKLQRPLGVRDQWVYHSRLYAATAFVSNHDNIELIQLTSFGCGLDAVTTDEVAEILKGANKIYTLIKIDEINNLGSARIRVRSLIAAIKDRDKNNIKIKEPDLRPERVIFTEQMKKDHTLICPQMSPIHFEMVEKILRSEGYNVVVPENNKSCIDVGLRYVNNDACYPAIIAIGQIMENLLSGKYDLNNVTVIMSQTGGGCRASNYIGFIRKALKKANLEHIPVLSLNLKGLEKNPGFKLTLSLGNKILQSVIYGDILMHVLYATRPYEKVKGSANELYHKHNEIIKEELEQGITKNFNKNIKNIINDFDSLPIIEGLRKPKVGIVGEILVKYHPIANNDIVNLLESEGAEVVVPDFLDFFLYSFYNANFISKYLGGSFMTKLVNNVGIELVDLYRKQVLSALKKSKRFHVPANIKEIAKYAEEIVSLGNQTGEGWFLSGEMVKLLHTGVNNIVCTQPFACLPNHVVGKGVIKALKNKYPLANIVAIDYDPGASEVNQLNRIKLMLSVAFDNLNKAVLTPSEIKLEKTALAFDSFNNTP